MPYRFRILVVDDEPVQRELSVSFLKKRTFDVFSAESGAKAVELFRHDSIDLVLTDQKMPHMSGLDLLQAVRAINPEAPVILMTAFGSIEAAVSAIHGGATDYLTKPLNLDELLYRIRQVSDRYRIIAENRELREALQSRHRIEGIIGESGQMLEVLSLVRRVAPSEATVLIRGESGTGKELIAQAIHFASPRASGPLVKVNCAALPETLLESELFGHEKGAFTGAVTSRQWRFELANGGSFFLDEIGDILLRYDYPGNVRELENIIERSVVLTREDVIGNGDLPLTVQNPEVEGDREPNLTVAVEGLERRMIRDALARSDDVQTRAAELLGISERALRYKLIKYGFREEASSPDSDPEETQSRGQSGSE